MPGDRLARRVNIGADEFGDEAGGLGQQLRLGDRGRREIEPGGDRAVACQDQRVEPEMALQVDEALAGDRAEFAILDRVQRFPAGEKPLDRIKPAAVAAVDRHPFVPVAPVGGEELTEEQGASQQSGLSRQRFVDQCRIAFGKRIGDAHPFDRSPVLKIFADQQVNSSPPDRCPEQRVPKGETMLANRTHSMNEIARVDGLDRDHRLPALDKGRRNHRACPDLSSNGVEKLAQ
jgi:hypothetical protein